jgi:predicted PurR-regulated permease PerM
MTISGQPFYLKATVMMLFFALVIAFMILAQNILVPLVFSIFFTFLLLPVSGQLEKWKFPKTLAILISILLSFIVFGTLLYIFFSQIASFINDWPTLQKTINAKWGSLQEFIAENFNVSKEDQVIWISNKIKENASQGGVMIFGIFSATTSFLASFTLIPIYVFFLTLYKDKIKEFVRLISKENHDEKALLVVKKVSKVSQKYLTGIFLDVLILSVLNSAGFLILGLPHAIMFGVLISVLNIIPYVGILLGSLLPILMAFLTFDSIGYTIGAAGVCVFVQFLDNNFITPMVVGSSVSINPLTATIALIASAIIWGIPGMILCMPLTGMVKVVCDNVESLKPVGFLLGEKVNFNQPEQVQNSLLKKVLQKIKRIRIPDTHS